MRRPRRTKRNNLKTRSVFFLTICKNNKVFHIVRRETNGLPYGKRTCACANPADRRGRRSLPHAVRFLQSRGTSRAPSPCLTPWGCPPSARVCIRRLHVSRTKRIIRKRRRRFLPHNTCEAVRFLHLRGPSRAPSYSKGALSYMSKESHAFT